MMRCYKDVDPRWIKKGGIVMGILYLDMFKWNRLHLYRKKFTERCISVFKTHSQSLAQVNTMHNALEGPYRRGLLSLV